MPIALAQYGLFKDHATEEARKRMLNRKAATPEQVKANAEHRMAQVDALNPETRALVHEFGWQQVRPRLGMSARAMRFDIERTQAEARARAERAELEADLSKLELDL